MTAFADLRLLAVSRALRKVKHVNQPLIMLRRKIALRDGPLEKLCGGGGGDFRAAGIVFRYQIPV